MQDTMKPFANTAWWIAFLMPGIILQAYFPGLDALILGVLLLIEEKNYRTLVWFVPAIIFLQDGMGTQAFGSTLLCVTLCYLLYTLTRRIARASRYGFYFLLSLCMGGVRLFLDWLFASLEELPYIPDQLLYEGCLEAAYLFSGWIVLRRLRVHCLPQETEA